MKRLDRFCEISGLHCSVLQILYCDEAIEIKLNKLSQENGENLKMA
jgi:hypothetical protein